MAKAIENAVVRMGVFNVLVHRFSQGADDSGLLDARQRGAVWVAQSGSFFTKRKTGIFPPTSCLWDFLSR
jgi:hypothetical protein